MDTTSDTSFSSSTSSSYNSPRSTTTPPAATPKAPKPKQRQRQRQRHQHGHRARALPSPPQSNPDTGLEEGNGLLLQQQQHSQDAVDEAYRTIWNSFCGLPAQLPYPTFHIHSQDAYEYLHIRLAEHPGLLEHFEGAIRKDWDATTGDLTLRLMASPLHDVFKRCVESAIEIELARIITAKSLPFNIISGSHSTIQKRPKSRSRLSRSSSTTTRPIFEKSPDGQFYYDSADSATSSSSISTHHHRYRYPPFVFEVAYSQDRRNVHQTATDYFKAMPGKICTVLAIEIDYTEPQDRKEQGHCHSASLALWTSELEEEHNDGQEDGSITISHYTRCFRQQSGRPMPGELVLPFRHFLPLEERSRFGNDSLDSEIRLSFAKLSKFVTMAEKRQRLADASISPEPPPTRRKTIKKIKWKDEGGDFTEQRLQTESKRQRTSFPGLEDVSPSLSPVGVRTRSRTRSLSQPRRSSRLRSRSGSIAGDANEEISWG